jgi:uncharacterized protein YqgC (DUF456 family)
MSSILSYLPHVLGWLAIVLGLLGNLLPILPGAPLMLVGMILIAYLDGFELIGGGTLVFLGVLTALTLLVDLVASMWGAARVGASKLALVGATIGTVVGLFFGLIGVLFAPFFGAMAGELLARGGLVRSSHVGVGTWLGMVFGAAAKLALAAIMLAVFIFFYVW